MKIAFSNIALLLFSLNTQAGHIEFSEAWYQVVQKNDALQAKQEEIKYSQAMQDAAKSLYLPQVDITGSYTYLDKPLELSTGIPEGTVLPLPGGALPLPSSIGLTNQEFGHSSVNVMLPVYTGGQITAAQDIRAAQVDEARGNYNLAQRNTFTQLVEYYFGVVLSEQVYQARLDAVEALSNHLNHAMKLEEQGQIAKVERLSAQVSLDKAKIEAQKAFRTDEISKLALTVMLKEHFTVYPTTPLFINNEVGPILPFLEKTLKDHPGIEILQSKREQAKGMVKMASAKHMPTVALYGNYNLYEDDSVAGELVPEWMVGIGVKIPIIERNGSSDELVAAHSSVRRVGLLNTQMQQDLTVLVEKTYAEMMQALEEYNSLLSSEMLAQETVMLRKKAFSQGLSTSLEVVDAQLFATSIRVQRLSASYNYIKALAQLLSVSGNIDSFMNYLRINGIEVK